MMKNLIQFTAVFIAVLISATGGEEYAQVGDTVTLRISEVDATKHYVHWYFGSNTGTALAWLNPLGGRTIIQSDEEWRNRLTLTDNSLTIKDFQEKFFGTFICEVKLSGRTVSTYTYKVIKYTVSVDPEKPLLPGDTLSLTCDVATQTKPSIHWLNPREEKVKHNQASFTTRATTQDSGRWACVVTNQAKEYKGSVSVTVLSLSPVPSRLYTSSKTRLTVPCSFPSYISWNQIKEKDIQEVQWHFLPKSPSIHFSAQELYSLSVEDSMEWTKKQDRGLTPVTGLEKGNLSLTRNRGKEDDAGDYMCLMKFKNGVVLNSTVHVEVLQIISSQGTEFISGQRVNLSCTTGEPLPPDMKLKWFPPAKSSLPTSDRNRAHVTDWEVGTGDSGNWKCELWQSNVLVTSAVITLKIEPKLSVWMLVIICSAAVIILLLIVLALILCRRRQRKMRRPRFCQCKNPKGFYKT